MWSHIVEIRRSSGVRQNWQSSCAWHHGAIKPALERDWRSGKIPDAALRLDSAPAQRLTRMKYRPAIGADGYPIEGT